MSKYEYTVKVCQVCGREQKSKDNIRWDAAFGKIKISFKEMPCSQRDYSIESCCPSCCFKIEKRIEELLKGEL